MLEVKGEIVSTEEHKLTVEETQMMLMGRLKPDDLSSESSVNEWLDFFITAYKKLSNNTSEASQLYHLRLMLDTLKLKLQYEPQKAPEVKPRPRVAIVIEDE